MNLDANDLPVQSNGDANDQLNRCGLIDVGVNLILASGRQLTVPPYAVWDACAKALFDKLYLGHGTYVRCVGNNSNNVSADQLIPVVASHVLYKSHVLTLSMFIAMLKRFGFAQNTRDGISASDKWKLPDFMLFRAMPLFTRAHWALRPLSWVFDLYLIIMALSAILDRNPDHVDDNDTIVTFATCRHQYPTLISRLAIFIYSECRAWNYGCYELMVAPGSSVSNMNAYKPVYGALRWYHRTQSGGNPEIAELWQPVIDKYFGGSK